MALLSQITRLYDNMAMGERESDFNNGTLWRSHCRLSENRTEIRSLADDWKLQFNRRFSAGKSGFRVQYAWKKWEDRLIIWQDVTFSNMDSQNFLERRIFMRSSKPICCKFLHSNRESDRPDSITVQRQFTHKFLQHRLWKLSVDLQSSVEGQKSSDSQIAVCYEKDRNNGHSKRPFQRAGWQKKFLETFYSQILDCVHQLCCWYYFCPIKWSILRQILSSGIHQIQLHL